MSLKQQPILIVDCRITPFVWTLQCVLEQAGAEVMVARDALRAMEHLHRFSFSACILGALDDAPQHCRGLLHELAGLPTITYGGAVRPAAIAVVEDVPAIVRALKARLA